ncbi:MAG: M23 family metallopeptidase [Acidimicrobiia bacterium]
MKPIALVVGGLVAFVLSITVVIAGPGLDAGPPSAVAIAEIPPTLLPVYIDGASTCPGLPWQVLAAIGFIESRHGSGRLDPATGTVQPPIMGPALDGTNGNASIPDPSMPDGWAHALGPMQFLSTTWAAWGRVAPGRPASSTPDVHNAWDAIYGAAAYLCDADGQLDDLDAAILTYNHSREYLDDVMAKAVEYGLGLLSGADGVYCPVAGPVTFRDDWGEPRSGGRTHQGNDLFAPHGTPLVAIESGTISQVSDADVGLGGITVWLAGDSGTSYYYAHNAVNAVRAGERVRAGQLLAYVGNTGNAATTPSHVHFQLHPGGGAPLNPYPVVVTVCPR